MTAAKKQTAGNNAKENKDLGREEAMSFEAERELHFRLEWERRDRREWLEECRLRDALGYPPTA